METKNQWYTKTVKIPTDGQNFSKDSVFPSSRGGPRIGLPPPYEYNPSENATGAPQKMNSKGEILPDFDEPPPTYENSMRNFAADNIVTINGQVYVAAQHGAPSISGPSSASDVHSSSQHAAARNLLDKTGHDVEMQDSKGTTSSKELQHQEEMFRKQQEELERQKEIIIAETAMKMKEELSEQTVAMTKVLTQEFQSFKEQVAKKIEKQEADKEEEERREEKKDRRKQRFTELLLYILIFLRIV